LTTALEGGEGSTSHPGRSLPPGKTWYPFYRRLGGPQGRSVGHAILEILIEDKFGHSSKSGLTNSATGRPSENEVIIKYKTEY